MIMKWCTVQTNEYDLQAKSIRIFELIINCKIIMKTNSRFSRKVYAISDRIWCNKHVTTAEKYDNNGKVDTSDLIMIITWAIDISFQSLRTEMGQLNTYNPIYCNENKKVIDRTSSMLKTPPQDTLQTFICIQCLWVVLHNDENGRQ